MFKELKETMIKEQKRHYEMWQQVETINKETGIIKKNRMEILELKITITEVKNSLKGPIGDLN